MAKLNLGTKVENEGATSAGRVSAAEINAVTASVNALYDALFISGIITNGMNPKVLPESLLSPDQFEILGDGHIGLIGFDNIGEGSGLPKPEAPTIVVDTVTREISFEHAEYPDDLEYRVNSGAWTAYVAGTLINFGSGAILANYYQARTKAIAGETQAGTIAGNNFISAVGGDTSLIDGNDYLDLSVLTGTPPLEPTNNTWKITGDGFGQGQPGKRLAVGGHIAFIYQANSANTKMSVNYVAGSLGNFKAIDIEVNVEGVLRVVDTRDTIDEDLPTQPTTGQFVDLERVSGATTPSTFRVSIIDTDRTTVVYFKDYVVTSTPVADCSVEYDTAGGSAVINKPQGRGLTDI